MIREDESKHIFKCKQVFNQYLTDMAAKIESERLLYIRLNQKKLRAESYIHLRDALSSDGNAKNIGKSIILPSSFTGSPRNMQEYAQDAMAYVRKNGRPDLFLTFTCNPSWPEIKNNLFDGQSQTDRHDIIARVFNQKFIMFMNMITKEKIFGDVQCYIDVIEWQKRGLPHGHVLIWLKKKIQPTEIDKIISAEIPNQIEDPVLFNIITKHMIHGPCGTINTKSPCMNNGQCSKRYPREMMNDTQTGSDGYPLYRRRNPNNGGFKTILNFKNNPIDIDNRWIVPYSPILSKAFNAHINVEYCNSVKSIKYVCKYVYKGCDMAVIGTSKKNSTHDEVTQFQLGRYMSSNEAAWRIFGFNIHNRYPTVVHLDVHLENDQRIIFTEENAEQKIQNPTNTTLTAFFKLCQQDEFAQKLLYHEIPSYFTWDKSKKEFRRRKRGRIHNEEENIHETEAIGRVYTVHPNKSECYFLRMLLHEIPGPKSFEDLRTIDGINFATYRETCLHLGLLENDHHWNLALAEATLSNSPSTIRTLFSIILTTCNPSNPKGIKLSSLIKI